MRLAGWSSMLVLPDKWSNPVPFVYGTNCLVCLDVRLNSDFPGTVKMNYNLGTGVNKEGGIVYYNDVVSFGFNNPNTSGSTNEYWHVGAIQGGAFCSPTLWRTTRSST